MRYDDLFLRGGFINLLIKYDVRVKKFALRQIFILTLFIFVGFFIFFLARDCHVSNKWNLLLTIFSGLAGGCLLSLDLSHHLGKNKNSFLREIFPMELTSAAIPTIVYFINKRMIWIYLFWLWFLIMSSLSHVINYPNVYMLILTHASIYYCWIMSNFFLIIYLFYKKILNFKLFGS